MQFVDVKATDVWGDLMRAALAGDDAAYARLLSALSDAFRTAATRRLARFGHGNADIEDIVQEALLAIHLKRGTWEASRPFAPWANAVLMHKIADRMRRNRRPVEPLDEAVHATPAQEVDVTAAADIDRMLSRLEPQQRRVVIAVSLEGRSAADVARETNSTEGAIRVALHRALKRLAVLFREDRA